MLAVILSDTFPINMGLAEIARRMLSAIVAATVPVAAAASRSSRRRSSRWRPTKPTVVLIKLTRPRYWGVGWRPENHAL